ncbi:FkbM family methyltransferase [Sphingosinicella sp. BN140058]|uniref:FkbM family methyltransferase n=1 Tax=Sphingosinicella sp. BN140058 TaxID=1892855 RepID=UPI0010102DBF|nr:FkbM family methyltransferase [Sphingosinicella sp. BN140058]QAY77933.1 FkbM family methyltransferase [Sphingosinicella sp. BN140058]
MTYARSLARKTLRAVGVEKIKHPCFADFMQHEGIDTLLDVGGNEGHFALEMRERGFRGRIISFEPIAEVYGTLATRAANDPHWNTHRLALGDEASEAEISIATAHVFSSFKRPSAYTSAKFVGAQEQAREIVPIVRLDQFLDAHPDAITSATYLKIDTQGFEREVLAGAGTYISRFRSVQLELPLRELYEGQPTLCEMVQWMERRGFEIAMAKENGFDWQACRLLEMDVVFTRKAP